MISNNPYSLPERPSQKSSTIYSQQDSAQFRKSDSTEFSHKLTSPSQYINRTHHPPIPSSNNALKKSTINLDETIPSYRPPPYQNTTQNVKNFLQSPKNNPSSTFPNLNNYNNLSGSRGAIKHNSPGDRKQSVNMAPLRESFGIKILDSKQANQKIEILTQAIKKLEKRLIFLERQSQNNSHKGQFFQDSENISVLNDLIQKNIFRYHQQWQENIKYISEEMSTVKETIKSSIKSQSIDKIVYDKVKQYSQITKCSQSIVNSYFMPQENISQIKKQTQMLRNELQEKIRKNNDFLTALMGRLERQVHSMSFTPQIYKPSALKCSGSAILLRFVESFRVRKNAFKSESKIVITDNTYYIDNEGYLLDKDQHYLVDSKGKQVRLEQRHIKLLREEQVLQ